jgi:hypothetical protein
MKDLGMNWNEIKDTPTIELTALLQGLSNYNVLHAFDGYSSEDVSDLAKNKPSVRMDYAKSMAMKEKYGMRKKPTSFHDIIG